MNGENENKEIEIDLLELAGVLLSKISIIITISLLGGLIALCFASFYLPEKYSSYTSMYVKNVSDEMRVEQQVTLNELNASKSLLSTYIAVLQSDAVMDQIGERLLKQYTVEEISSVFPVNEKGQISTNAIKSCFSMASVEDTEVLKISAKTTSPEVSADVCRIIADIAPDFLIRVVGAGSVEVIDPAKVNYRRVEPNIKKMTVLGCLLGFIASAGVIVLLYLLDNSVKSTDELKKRFNKAIIGEVYNFAQEQGEKKQKRTKDGHRIISPESLIDENTVFTVSESYKTMRTNTVFALSPFDKKIISVTSANAAEGKSTTTANLAISFSQTECKVLLIDADLRKPTQHKLFSVNNKVGLSTALGKMNKVENSIIKGVRKNLDLMPAGPIPPNPSELLASQQFDNIISELVDQYDFIMIDTPPVNVVSDVLVMSNVITGVLFVSSHGETTYDSIESALQKLEMADINVLGFILNNITAARTGKYYSYRYKYGYSKYGYGYSRYGYGYDYSYGGKEYAADEETADTGTKTETKTETKTSASASGNSGSSGSKNNNHRHRSKK
ncbi:MAG: polysaccharide biosynthesis tyrosine autokinase [Firmicutes bacterium]|nr:polysaccharide biosynthesis tyrosine autokinase [Bacillota bacterium]